MVFRRIQDFLTTCTTQSTAADVDPAVDDDDPYPDDEAGATAGAVVAATQQTAEQMEEQRLLANWLRDTQPVRRPPDHQKNAHPNAQQATTQRQAASQEPTDAGWRGVASDHVSDTPQTFWSLYESAEFATLWYDAREAGERLRAQALRTLYTRRRTPGGHSPDPREPAAFSERAVVSAAAATLGVSLWQQPLFSSHAATATDPTPANPASNAPQTDHLIYLITTPPDITGHQHPPLIRLPAIDPTVRGATDAPILFDLACMLGFITRHPALLDPYAPHAATSLPRNSGITALLHQFAIALLCLDPACPPEWDCPCNAIRRRLTAPPADHEQPTEVITMRDIARSRPRDGANNHTHDGGDSDRDDDHDDTGGQHDLDSTLIRQRRPDDDAEDR